MLTVEILLDGLDSKLLYSRSNSIRLGYTNGSLLADRDEPLLDDYIYIGNWWDMPEHIPSVYRNIWFFCAGGGSFSGDPGALCGGSENVFLFDLTLTKLYNRIAGNHLEYRRWLDRLKTLEDLQSMCKMTAEKIGQPLAVLNSFGQQIAEHHSSRPHSSVFDMLLESGQLSYEMAHNILESEKASFHKETIVFEMNGVRLFDHQIRYDGKVVARIMAEYASVVQELFSEPYLDDFVRCIRPRLLSSDSMKKLSINAVSALVADIIEQKITSQEEIEQRLELVPDMVRGKPFHPVVLKFSWQIHKVPYNYISGQLEQIFPRSSVITYNDGLVVLAMKNTFAEALSFDRARLIELLDRFEAFAGIGGCSPFLTSLRPLYIQASATTRLGQVFCRDPGERIFFYEDYSHYFIVDLCVEDVIKQHNFGTLNYLCHPGLISLLRYDNRYGTALAQTLRVYIESNCNATACAQAMNVHRNTVNYRINLIEDLISGSLSDVYLRQKLLFSYELLEYESKYLQQDPLDTANRTNPDASLSLIRSITEKQ